MTILFMDRRLVRLRKEIDKTLDKWEARVPTLIFLRSLLYQDTAYYVSEGLKDEEIRTGVSQRINRALCKDLDPDERETVIDECVPLIIDCRNKWKEVN